MFGVDSLKQAKGERLMYGESVMTHAMVLTGVNLVVSLYLLARMPVSSAEFRKIVNVIG